MIILCLGVQRNPTKHYAICLYIPAYSSSIFPVFVWKPFLEKPLFRENYQVVDNNAVDSRSGDKDVHVVDH